jgi:hypothetical protein
VFCVEDLAAVPDLAPNGPARPRLLFDNVV